MKGYDANALYLYALAQPMPTEHPIIRQKHNNFRAEVTDSFGQQAREWLEYTAQKEKISIQHKFNGREKRLGRRNIAVDGWHAESKTVFQFHGCLFHGHDCHLTQNFATNPYNHKPMVELRDKTLEITRYLSESVGVSAVGEMWECEWENARRRDHDIKQFIKKHLPTSTLPTETFRSDENIVSAIQNEKLFWMVKCDVRVPVHLENFFSELQPIFKNCDISRDDLGPFMKEYVEKHDLLKQPRRTLVGSYFGKDILLATPLLRWYANHGLEISNISLVIQYRPKPCFQNFSNLVTEARRTGDVDPSQALLGDIFKLLGNSAYGKTLTNLANHRNVNYFADAQKITHSINNPRFVKIVEITDNVVEIESEKDKIKWNLPIQIVFIVYQYAKLRMLEFYYDFLDTFVNRVDFQLLEMDTDSLYMSLSDTALQHVVIPTKRDLFFKTYDKWFPAPACEHHTRDFRLARDGRRAWDNTFCAECILAERKHKRTPGLFKIEYEGSSFIGLCSKTYFCVGNTGTKVSCKGLNKKLNVLIKSAYKNVLDNQESAGGTNMGFQTDGRHMFTYTQTRKSLSFLYIKREVLVPDGVNTGPTHV